MMSRKSKAVAIAIGAAAVVAIVWAVGFGPGADRAGSAGSAAGVESGAASGAASGVASTSGAQFATPKLLNSHFEKHGADVGASTPDQYLGMAQRFVESSGAAGVQTVTRTGGDRLMYNAATREFAVLAKSGRIRTYFKTDPEYWERQLQKRARGSRRR